MTTRAKALASTAMPALDDVLAQNRTLRTAFTAEAVLRKAKALASDPQIKAFCGDLKSLHDLLPEDEPIRLHFGQMTLVLAGFPQVIEQRLAELAAAEAKAAKTA